MTSELCRVKKVSIWQEIVGENLEQIPFIISFWFYHQIKSFEPPMTYYRLEIPEVFFLFYVVKDETTLHRWVYSTCCVESEMIRYISWGTIFESWDRVCETTAPVPCVSGIGTGHSNASHGQEPPLPLTWVSPILLDLVMIYVLADFWLDSWVYQPFCFKNLVANSHCRRWG